MGKSYDHLSVEERALIQAKLEMGCKPRIDRPLGLSLPDPAADPVARLHQSVHAGLVAH